jgi:hypothetical protein
MMMMPTTLQQPIVPKSKFVYLSSRSRSAGTPNDAFYLLDSGIRCGKRPGEYITMTPLFFTIQRGWDIINNVNRHVGLAVDGVKYTATMKIGSGYSVNSFGQMLTLALDKVSPGFVVSYDKISNRFTFTPPDEKSYVLHFPHRHATIFFGFPSSYSSTPAFKKSAPLTSEVNVSMTPQVSLVVRSDLPTAECYDNFTHRNPINTGVLVVVPIDCPPFAELQYQCATPDTGTLRVCTEHVHSIRLMIGDETGLAVDCGDYVIGIRFDLYPAVA